MFEFGISNLELVCNLRFGACDLLLKGVSMWFGVAIIIVGVILLLQNLGLVSGGVWDVVWPALIIMLGASILAKRDRRISFDDVTEGRSERKKEAEKK